jgi:hypothetical protein
VRIVTDGYSDARLPQTNHKELSAPLLQNGISSLRVGQSWLLWEQWIYVPSLGLLTEGDHITQ